MGEYGVAEIINGLSKDINQDKTDKSVDNSMLY